MSSLLTMIGAAGGSSGPFYFLGAATGASTNNQSQNVFKFSPTEYKGASNSYDSNGDLYFGYFTVINTTGYEGVGIAKFTGADGEPVGSQTGLFRKSNNNNEVGLYQGPNCIDVDNSTNLVFLVRGDMGSNERNAVVKLGDSSDGTNPANWGYNKVKSRYFGDSSFTTNMYGLCKNKESGSDHFYGVGHTQAVGRGNQFLIQKYDMNNPTGTPSITWSKYFDNGNSNCNFYSCDSDTSGNLYACGIDDGKAVVAKFNNSGTNQWARRITGDSSTNHPARSIVCSDDGSDIYVAFDTHNFGTQSSSYKKSAIAKISSSDGSITWVRIIVKQQANEHMEGNCLAIDSSSNWYMLLEGQSVDSSLSQGLISGDSSGNTRWQTMMKAGPLSYGQNDLTYEDRGDKRWLAVSPDDSALFFSTTSSSSKNSINYRGMGVVPSDGTGTDNSDFVIDSSNLNFTGVRYASYSPTFDSISPPSADASGSVSDRSMSDSSAYGNQNSSDWLTTTSTDKIKNTFGNPYTGNF